MSKVTVRAKDIRKVIEKADDVVRWGPSSSKARRRLLEACLGLEERPDEQP